MLQSMKAGILLVMRLSIQNPRCILSWIPLPDGNSRYDSPTEIRYGMTQSFRPR